MYNNFKEYEINIAESRIFQNFVTTSSALNEAIINQYNNLYKEDYLVGIHYQPYVQVDVNIDRGNGDAFESFYKLMEIKTMQDLENYQNGGFFKIEKLN